AQVARRPAARHHVADPDRVDHAVDLRRHLRDAARLRLRLGHQPGEPAARHHRAVVGGARYLDHGAGRPRIRPLPGDARRRARSDRSAQEGIAVRWSLFGEILRMSWDTVRENKLRSFLTVLGIVIGITSIVGMTAMVRGFDQSIRDMFRSLGPNTVYLTKMSIVSFSSGAEFRDLIMRPNITANAAETIARQAPSIQYVDSMLGEGPSGQAERLYYGNQRTKPMAVIGGGANWQNALQLQIESGRFFTTGEVERRSRVAVLGQAPAEALFPNVDPIGKNIRIGFEQF